MLTLTALDGLNVSDPIYNYIPALHQTKSRSNHGAMTGYTVVNKFLPGSLVASGANCRIKLAAYTTQPITINTLYIGNPATSGNAYNFDGNQVQGKFNSSAAVTIPKGGTVYTDNIQFSLDQEQTILVAMDLGTAAAVSRVTGLGSKFVRYYKSGTQQAGTTSKSTGYSSTSGYLYITFDIEVSD